MNQPIKDLLERYKAYLEDIKPREDIAKIHVDEIAAKVATFYEKLRSFIDYQEEHLLRKNYIGRVFRRRFFFRDVTGNFGESFIKEVIRSGRLPNDSVPETKIEEVDLVVNGYVQILNDLKKLRIKREEEVSEWLTRITINAIEEILFPPLKEELIAGAMFWSIKEKMTLGGVTLSEGDRNIQLFIGVQRALLKVDEDQLNYRLFKFIYPSWSSLPDAQRNKFVKDLASIKDSIEGQLSHTTGKHFFKLCNKFNTVFYLVGDIIDKKHNAEELESIFEDEKSLEKEIKSAYRKRFEKEGARLSRLAFFSVLSIFLSKIIVALGVEVPLDIYVTQEFHLINTLINIVFPPLLMLIIVMSIKMPSDKNIQYVLGAVNNIFYGSEKKGFGLVIPKKKPFFTRAVIFALYLLIFFFVFQQLFMLLRTIGFSLANIAIFAFFTSLVAATGVKVHNRAKEISMEETKPKVSGFIIDVVSLPFITVGKWGLAALNKLNILVVIFNLVIELPFQMLVQFIENFRSFVKSKKEELH